MGEWFGVLIAIVSSSLGGTAAAVTRYLVVSADPITLAILRWGIGFLCLSDRIFIKGTLASAQRSAGCCCLGSLFFRSIFCLL